VVINEKIYTVSDAAKYAEVSTKTIHRHIKSGKLKATKNIGDYGPEWQITQTDLDSWLDDRRGDKKTDEPMDVHHKQYRQTKDSLVPWEDVQRLQENLVGAARTIGKLEATVELQSQEIERLKNKISELEKQSLDNTYKAIDERIDNVLGQHMDRVLKELNNKKPWWKFWD
jgi:excisionase family DNA binding protein